MPAARRPLAPFLVLGVDILDALDLASGEEASPPAIYEPEPGVAQELDGSRWVVDVDPAHRGRFDAAFAKVEGFAPVRF